METSLVVETQSRSRNLSRAFQRIVSFPVLLALTLATATVFMTCSESWARILVEGDTWWHLSVGQTILSTRHWPTADPYSFTAHGSSWLAYEWLGEVLMAAVFHLGSLRGLQVLLVFLSVGVVLLTYVYAWVRTGNHLASAAAVGLVMQVEGPALTLRPQLLGYIFLLITLIYLDLFKQGRLKSLWFLPCIFAVWVNTHGSFVLGLFFLAAYWLGGLTDFRWGNVVAESWNKKQREHLLLVSFLSVLALSATPYGTRLAVYPVEFAFMQPLNVHFTVEWLPIDFQVAWGQAFLLCVLAWMAAQLIFPIVYRVEVVLPVLLFAYETFMHRRFLLVFAAVFAPILATLLAQWLPSYEASKERYVMNTVFILSLLYACVLLIPSNTALWKMLRQRYPMGAVEYLRTHPVPTGMFNDDHWGGFLIWSLGTGHQVFIDGRLDIYEYSGVLADFISIEHAGRNAPLLLQARGINSCLLQRDDALVAILSSSSGWEKEYEDDNSIIFKRMSKSESSAREKNNEMGSTPARAGQI